MEPNRPSVLVNTTLILAATALMLAATLALLAAAWFIVSHLLMPDLFVPTSLVSFIDI